MGTGDLGSLGGCSDWGWITERRAHFAGPWRLAGLVGSLQGKGRAGTGWWRGLEGCQAGGSRGLAPAGITRRLSALGAVRGVTMRAPCPGKPLNCPCLPGVLACVCLAGGRFSQGHERATLFSPLLPLRVGLSPGQGSINPQPPGFRLLFPGSPGLPPWLPRHCRALALPPAQGLAPVGGDWGLPQRCSVQPGCALPRLLPLAAASGWDCKPAGQPPPSASASPSPAQAQRPQPLLSSLCWRTGNGPSLAGVRQGLQDSAPRRRPRSLSGCRLMPIPAAWGESSEPISPSQPGTDPRKELGLPCYWKGAQPRHGSVLSWEEPPARVPLSLTLC